MMTKSNECLSRQKQKPARWLPIHLHPPTPQGSLSLWSHFPPPPTPPAYPPYDFNSFCSKTTLHHCYYFANTLVHVHIGPSSFNAHDKVPKFRSLSSTSSLKNRITKRVHTVSRKSFLSFLLPPIPHFCIATIQALTSELRFKHQRDSKKSPRNLSRPRRIPGNNTMPCQTSPSREGNTIFLQSHTS